MFTRFDRLDFSNETKSTVCLDGNSIKSIASGGDKIVARNHCKGEEPLTPHFMTYIMANDLNRIVPLDNAVSDDKEDWWGDDKEIWWIPILLQNYEITGNSKQ